MSNVIRIVTIDLMRHGEKSGDLLTALGLDQVEASARAHLHGVQLDAAYHSDTNRAREAVTHALVVLEQRKVVIARHEAFTTAVFFGGDILADLIAADKAVGKDGTMAELVCCWNAGEAARGQVQGGLMNIAGELAMLDPDGLRFHVLVGFNDPLIGVAAVDLDDMPARFNFADIVRYTLTNDGSGWVIAASVHLKCPLVKLGA